jgi:hypothetical protein
MPIAVIGPRISAITVMSGFLRSTFGFVLYFVSRAHLNVTLFKVIVALPQVTARRC